jgi:transposase-like protein
MKYRVGDWVEVLSPEEILQTLDDKGAVDNMPFMPEMLQFAGKRLKVSASAHKACDTIESFHNRSVENAVHLGVRCDGSAHGGCQAACLLYWKTAWLKPAGGPAAHQGSMTSRSSMADTSVIDRATRVSVSDPGERQLRYSCQATRLVEASSPMQLRDVRQYWKDLTSGNVSLWSMIRYMALALYNTLVYLLGRGRTIPSINGLAGRKTPSELLDLQPGELVEVKSADEIMTTLDAKGANRGMTFDTEMLPFCGKRYRVKQRVNQLINEKTGVMMTMKTPGVILENVVCMGLYHPERLFCPRDIYPYWREIWLKRIEEDK